MEGKYVEDTCTDCCYFVESPAGTHGYCKRYPPVFTHKDDNGRPRFFNPVVSPSNFCGEFKELPD